MPHNAYGPLGSRCPAYARRCLKWSPPGKTALAKGDQFGFELGGRTPSTLFAHAFEAAEILGARNLRVLQLL